MKKIRLLSAFLAVALTIGMSPVLPVFAADTTAAEEDAPLVPGLDPETGEPIIDYLSQKFKTPEDKLATMKSYLKKGDMELFVEPVTGEIAYVNNKTGQIIFSNPYDVASSGATKSVKQELLSQISIKYTDNANELEMFSFVEACERGQIIVKKIKNGVRVEYSMGRTETRKLVPKQINKERFETLILNNIPEGPDKEKFIVYYTLQDAYDPEISDRAKREIIAEFPICEEMAIYTYDAFASDREMNFAEDLIKKYCPEYTYETLEEDHGITGYVANDKAPVLFRLALEYSLDEDGNLDVRLPANGIRFDESAYQLDSISILPWFGAGSSSYEGYTFMPDGSGALVRFEDVIGKQLTLTGKIYGQDYAYQEVSGNNKEVMRMPVYGLVESDVYVPPVVAEGATPPEPPPYKQSTGFFAILEEGDSLAEISSEHGGTIHKYNSIYPTFYPRPKDTYNLADTISVGANAEYTIVSERKYTGSYRIKFVMLTSDKTAEEVGLDSDEYYVDSYVGMAKAYRDYLIDEGILTEFEKDDINNNIPLYIESFGAIETTERVLSIPVNVLKPLTTFDDLKTMTESLEAAGIDANSINYKLTGFANGGMDNTVPNRAEFVKAVGGNKGFSSFAEYATSKGVGVYPDFDFAYMSNSENFDGFSAKKHLAKAMDNRYASKQVYDPAWQEFLRAGKMVISASVYDDYLEGLDKDYAKLNPNGISVSTLGTDLNSDFDKKDPYNREDSKAYTLDALAAMQEAYGSVMVDGGNAYSLNYVDHILGVSLDSSRYSRASEAVPFVGMVLHGCVNFSGDAINMAGDTEYEILKAIENGSAIYFTLSMQNTSLLKENEDLSKYYSVSFDIWYEELVELYNTLNDATSRLQDKQIVDHEFIIGERVPTAEELAADQAEAEAEAARNAEAEALKAEKEELKKLREERLAALRGETVDTPAENDNQTIGGNIIDLTPVEEKVNKYLCDDGRIVRVEYEGGKSFILNYNNFEVQVEYDGVTYAIDALDFVVMR